MSLRELSQLAIQYLLARDELWRFAEELGAATRCREVTILERPGDALESFGRFLQQSRERPQGNKQHAFVCRPFDLHREVFGGSENLPVAIPRPKRLPLIDVIEIGQAVDRVAVE